MSEIPIINEISDFDTNLTIVYLDLKGYINLTRPTHKNIRQFLLNKVKAREVICPISLSHIMEAKQIGSSRRRAVLSSLILELSNGYTISPLFDYRIELEVQNYLCKILQIKQMDNKKHIIKKGLANLAGGIPTITSRTPLNDMVSKKLVELTKQYLDDPYNIKDWIDNFPFTLDQFIDDWNSTIKLEIYRGRLLEIRNKEKRKALFMRENFEQFLEPIIISYFNRNKIDYTFLIKTKSDKIILELIDNIHTAFCFLNLLYYRDQQLERPIHENDNYDIWSLAQAMPYCDVIQADNLFANIAIQQKLDKKCNSTIIKSIGELPSLL